MRIQILPLPSVTVGDDTQEPFALIVDQWPDGAYDSSLQGFADMCGAKGVWVRPDTVEVVGRYAEPALREAPAGTTIARDGVLFGRRIRLEWPDGLPPEIPRETLATKVMNGIAKSVLGSRPIVLPDGNGRAINIEATCSCGSEMARSWSAIDSDPEEGTQERTQIACKICGNRLTVTHLLAGQRVVAEQDERHTYQEDDGACATCGLGRLARVHGQQT